MLREDPKRWMLRSWAYRDSFGVSRKTGYWSVKPFKLCP